jgi:uncharacterized protein (TIGR00369 family)
MIRAERELTRTAWWDDQAPVVAAAATLTGLELKVNFLRLSFGGGARLLAEGTVLNRGTTTALAEATITDADTAKKIAHATSTCLILQPRQRP